MRRVLVTGGGTGIGLAIARAFAAAGEGVTISGRREAPLRAAAAAGGFDWITADVTCEDDMPRLFARPFDVVVANAGSGQVAGDTADAQAIPPVGRNFDLDDRIGKSQGVGNG